MKVTWGVLNTTNLFFYFCFLHSVKIDRIYSFVGCPQRDPTCRNISRQIVLRSLPSAPLKFLKQFIFFLHSRCIISNQSCRSRWRWIPVPVLPVSALLTVPFRSQTLFICSYFDYPHFISRTGYIALSALLFSGGKFRGEIILK